jgi:zinc transport system substrate-binding protein
MINFNSLMRLWVMCFLLLSLAGCNSRKQKPTRSNIITVSILPQKYFVDQLSGNRFEVNVMLPPGANPMTYEPTPRQMKEIGVSSAYLRIGHIVFERNWMKKFESINPQLRVFDQSKDAKLIHRENHKGMSENNNSSGKGADPHIWLSPKSVKIQVRHIHDMLVKIDPGNKENYGKHYHTLLATIDSLDREIQEILSDKDNRSFMIFHPALTYFARDYHLEQIPIQLEGKEPTPARIRIIMDQAEERNFRHILVQKQFSTDEARTLAKALGGGVLRIDPMAYDWRKNMMQIARKVEQALGDS